MPQNITYSTGSTIAYTYDAAGKKLHVAYGSPNSTTDYCGNMIYENGTLTKILVDGGYITFSGTAPVYHYYLKDHQGNNRVVMSSSGTVEQVNHYFPYGYLFGESTNSGTQKYKYNDKEFDMTHGLHWYDYGARHYDPCIMRFTTMDPMCEKYYHLSPYAYCGNNPVRYIDIDGEEPGDFFLTKDAAAINFGIWFNDNSIRVNREFSSSIVAVVNKEGDKGYTYTIPNIGGRTYSSHSIMYGKNDVVGYVHTHAAYDKKSFNNEFSGIRDDNQNFVTKEQRMSTTERNDIGTSNRERITGYVVTPQGSLQKYEPDNGKITVINNNMPSDINDPSRLNAIGIEEKHPISIVDVLRMQDKLLEFNINYK